MLLNISVYIEFIVIVLLEEIFVKEICFCIIKGFFWFFYYKVIESNVVD